MCRAVGVRANNLSWILLISQYNDVPIKHEPIDGRSEMATSPRVSHFQSIHAQSFKRRKYKAHGSGYERRLWLRSAGRRDDNGDDWGRKVRCQQQRVRRIGSSSRRSGSHCTTHRLSRPL